MSVLTPILTRAADAASDPASRAVLRLSLLDWLACGIAGRDEPVARITRRLVLEEGGAPQARLFGGGAVPARAAALANGAASHALDYDDTHFAHIGHPSVAVLPAALALGQARSLGLEAILDAALEGAEASIRFGLLFGRSHYQQGFHQTGTAGAFGACLAAARLLGLSEAAMGHALGLVATRASGLKVQFGTMGKPYNAGIAAANGVEAAQLAALGMTSRPEALDGPNGFLATHHCDGAEAPPEPLLPSLSHKLHACCHGLHATLEALASLPRVAPESVTAVTIATHPRWLTVCHIPAPVTGLELKFSYRGIAAAALLGHDTAALETYTDALCAEPALVALRDRVTVTVAPDLSETEALVTLDTEAGQMEAHHDLSVPQPIDARAARLRAKAAALLGQAKAEALSRAIDDHDLAALTAAM